MISNVIIDTIDTQFCNTLYKAYKPYESKRMLCLITTNVFLERGSFFMTKKLVFSDAKGGYSPNSPPEILEEPIPPPHYQNLIGHLQNRFRNLIEQCQFETILSNSLILLLTWCSNFHSDIHKFSFLFYK